MAADPISLTAVPLIAKLASTLAEPTKGLAAKAKEKLEIRFKKGFERFINENVERFSTVKTIISTSTPLPFSSLYVNLLLAHPRKALRDDDFLKELATYKNVVFAATAGAGKSMLMRYLYLKFLETQSERLPVFIELRELNQSPTTSIQEHIQKKIGEYIEGFSEAQLRYALETGAILLFLDGFDEIDHDKRKEREKQINDLTARFKNLWMFVSSRPAETFASWERFHVFNVQPFTKKQVELLISKIDYDPEIKSLFTKKLAEGLYETHKEFLTNPLLTIMMLITLEQFAEIPAKIHLFYEYAFEALFGRHDVTKGGFQRKRHTTLALDDFKRLFSYFCMITYTRESINFSQAALLEALQQSITSSQITTDKTLFKKDLTESTCMLVLDGLEYTFCHRSFQEYFAAYFLSRVRPDEFDKALPKLVQRSTFDNVVKMVADMNREKFEEAWAVPALTKIYDRVKNISGADDCLSYAQALVGGEPSITVHGADNSSMLVSFTGADEECRPLRMALYRVYDVFDRIQSRIKDSEDRDAKVLKKLINGELLGKDVRFEKLRNPSKKKEAERLQISVDSKDSTWLKDSHFGAFIAAEAEILPQLLAEVKERVEKRTIGLASIFPE